jgi:toxin YoeB
MRSIVFHSDAFEQYNDWAVSDKKLFERIRKLIIECARDPFWGWESLSHLKVI